MPTFQSDKYPVLHIKLPSGTHVRFLNGTVEVDEAAAEELRNHQWYEGMFYEQKRVTWAAEAIAPAPVPEPEKGGDNEEKKPSKKRRSRERDLKHVVK